MTLVSSRDSETPVVISCSTRNLASAHITSFWDVQEWSCFQKSFWRLRELGQQEGNTVGKVMIKRGIEGERRVTD